jgi:hypothetical protein
MIGKPEKILGASIPETINHATGIPWVFSSSRSFLEVFVRPMSKCRHPTAYNTTRLSPKLGTYFFKDRILSSPQDHLQVQVERNNFNSCQRGFESPQHWINS